MNKKRLEDSDGLIIEIDQRGYGFAKVINSTFVQGLSDTQLKAVLGAYEAGSAKHQIKSS